MPEYLVRVQTARPASLTDEDWQEVVAAERKRGQELRRLGVIRGIWRVAGTMGNVGIWEAADTDALHAAITSLPAFRWMEIDVTPLSTHPLFERD